MTKRKTPAELITFPKLDRLLVELERVGQDGKSFRSQDLVNEERDACYVAKTLYKLVNRGCAHVVEYRRAEKGGNPYPVFRLGPGVSVAIPKSHQRGEIKTVPKPVAIGARPFGVPELWTLLRMGKLPKRGVTATRPPHLLDTPEDRL